MSACFWIDTKPFEVLKFMVCQTPSSPIGLSEIIYTISGSIR